MQVKETARIGFKSFLLSAAMVVASGFAIGVVAQESQPKDAPPQKTGATKKSTAGGRDPFRKYEPPAPQIKRAAGTSPIPTIQDRIAQYKAQKVAAMNARMPAPKPTTALLLSEIQVIGISRTPRGYAAIVEATPIKLSYVIYPGEPFFDGQLVAIEDNRLVFRRETVFTDGHRERSVEYKGLRQPTQVNSMSAPANQSVATANQ
ncbi:MAG TPA: hypothetical protein VFI24_16755 [Pyrinomonadaceae bacterium]|nr:hypothetical protein [Pyrinomonadaceae bacterium]